MTDDNMMDAVANSGDNRARINQRKTKTRRQTSQKQTKQRQDQAGGESEAQREVETNKEEATPPVAKGSILGEFEEMHWCPTA